ncbi:hypothetical protein C8A05DRAFT_32237 [Staphylotrichum tortipilum]|uniref:Spermatogenesis-associated protein 20-like TRX domain-containing protein n=1 Tax=Staphylotrichum tortipilum TaxID=2831512 RepID=A0AAN6MPG5_9PEZI|nr:hypothetical protein C8A05DRAFT_32237 [Staphylotrichum longicolle]
MMRAQLEQSQQRRPQPDDGAASDPPRGSSSSTSARPAPSGLPNLQSAAADSDSPYVRRHADTPVAWRALDEDTLARAAAENKPIFMHIGFLADHLCRLTTQDSFSHPAVAAFLNASFIPVLVDRDERPDLDTIYQNYSEAVNATGGWPLNLFLTPDLYPIFGGTYWPGPGTDHSAAADSAAEGDTAGEDSYNDFLAIAKKIHTFWIEQEDRCRREAFEMLHKLQDFAQEGTFGGGAGLGGTTTTITASAPTPPTDGDDLDLDQLDDALARITKMFDPVDFGFGTPKFPNPARLSFLLRLAHFPAEVAEFLGEREVANATAMARGTLRRVRDGALRDHLGEGFMRFSVTSGWSLPHFEKMVGDNALLLGVFLDAWLGAAREEGRMPGVGDEFAEVVMELADYLAGDAVKGREGGFVTAEAADSFYRRGDRHMREGAYYLWTRREFDQVVGPEGSDVAAAYWDVREDGNVPQDRDPFDEFINQNVLSAVKPGGVGELERQFGVPAGEVRRVVEEARGKLRKHRERERVRPGRDEKVVVATVGMVVGALARTGAAVRWVDKERGERYLKAAREGAAFVREKLWEGVKGEGNPLRRFYWERPSRVRGFADDYAFLIEGLLDLYTATAEREWLDWARELQDTQTRLFYDPPSNPSTPSPTPSPRQAYSGGFYSTEAATLSPTILRLKSGMDKSQPSTNAVAASNLFRLGSLLPEGEKYLRQARETVNAFEAEILQYPWLFVSLLTGVVTARLGVRRVEVGKEGEGRREWDWRPRGEAGVLVFVEGGKEEGLEGKVAGLRIGEREE